MKESEVKTKWCPMVRLGNMNEPTGINRGNNSTNKCIGSDCMMWESWEYEVKESITGEHDKVLIKNKGEGNCGLKPKELQCNV